MLFDRPEDSLRAVLSELAASVGAHWVNPTKILVNLALNVRPSGLMPSEEDPVWWSYTAELHFSGGTTITVARSSSSSNIKIRSKAPRR